MTTKVVNAFKYFGFFTFVFITLISCEKEIESIGISLVDNNTFNTDKLSSDVITENENIDKVPANGLPQYLLGVYSDAEFGKLKASIVSQVLPSIIGSGYDYGTNPGIDSVLVSIPYQSTRETENYADGKPKFSVDSVIGNTGKEFQLSVYELNTFLNTLDPNDPSKNAVYYSDKVFQKGPLLYNGNFKVNPDDTVTYVNRYLADHSTVYDRDTIKDDDLIPSIKIPLDNNLIKQIFVDNAANGGFESLDNFIHYFRGLYIEANDVSNQDSHLISLNMSGSTMIIYYSKDQDEVADQDLNGNGTTGETGVRTSHLFRFSLGSLKANVLERDYSNSYQSGSDRIYVQGASGSQATIELFSTENLIDLQTKNWLINDANLIFYVDQNASSNIAPEQLFLYNYDDKSQIIDMLTEGLPTVGGDLERDEEGNPYRYVFKITDYISNLLRADDSADLIKFGLRVYNPTDTPTSISDINIRDFSWNPKGVVLYNHNLSAGDKRVKLELFYTEINN